MTFKNFQVYIRFVFGFSYLTTMVFIFLQVIANQIGKPSKPPMYLNIDWSRVGFKDLPSRFLDEFKVFTYYTCILCIIHILFYTLLFLNKHSNVSLLLTSCFQEFKNPNPEIFGIFPEVPKILNSTHRWYGGETVALQKLNERLGFEEKLFCREFYLFRQSNPELLGPSVSLSPALRYGCLSIRKYDIK